jgi:pimeloyl-ACP methyl ester carboxylesterase
MKQKLDKINRQLLMTLVVLLIACSSAFSQTIKNVVLVHGAFADGSGWRGVYNILVKKGYHVVILQEPLTSLEDDVKALRHELDLLDGPCILVGHSYGGAVITEGGVHPKVAGLVYVAAFQPDKGESDLSLFQSAPVSPENAIQPPDNQGIVYIDRAKFASSFCQDIPKADGEFMAASQGQFAAKCFGAPITDPAWKHVPAYGIVATIDLTLNPDLERRMYARSNTKVTEIKGSHCVYISQPLAVADVIAKAATEISAKQ